MQQSEHTANQLILDAEPVRQHLNAIEAIVTDFQLQTETCLKALEAAEIGDPHGYLKGGIDDGYSTILMARTIKAHLDELLRNAHLTVNVVDAHDSSAQTAAPITNAQAELHIHNIAYTTQIASTIGFEGQSTSASMFFTTLPGGPLFDATGTIIRYDLTVAEFEMLTARERVIWTLQIENELHKGLWFHNIIDIIMYFGESQALDFMARGTWTSWADAGVLEALQNGFVLFNGDVPVSMSGGAAEKWEDFINFARKNDLSIEANKIEAKRLWAIAEQYSINYAVPLADRKVGPPVGMQGFLLDNFMMAGNTYRLIGRIPEGGGQIAVVMSERTGELAVMGMGEAMQQPGGQVIRVVFPISNLVYGLVNIPITKEITGEVSQFIGGNIAYNLGEAITDPRTRWGPRSLWDSIIPLGPGTTRRPIPGNPLDSVGPAYVSAFLIEYVTLLNSGAVPLPPGYILGVGGEITTVNGSRLLRNGTLQTRDGTQILPDSSIIDGNGNILPNSIGTVMTDSGSLRLSNGYITDPIF